MTKLFLPVFRPHSQSHGSGIKVVELSAQARFIGPHLKLGISRIRYPKKVRHRRVVQAPIVKINAILRRRIRIPAVTTSPVRYQPIKCLLQPIVRYFSTTDLRNGISGVQPINIPRPRPVAQHFKIATHPQDDSGRFRGDIGDPVSGFHYPTTHIRNVLIIWICRVIGGQHLRDISIRIIDIP